MCIGVLLPKKMFRRTHNMNQRRIFLTTLFVFSLIASAALISYGQGDARPAIEPSYQVSLQLVIGSSDNTGRGDLPANLSTISKELRSTFAFSNYRLAGTFLGRISNAGNFEYKSLSNIFGKETNLTSQSFLEWSLGNFRTGATAKGPAGFQAQAFRFGARVPVSTGSFKDETGKVSSPIAYEAIGLNLSRVGLPENTPTLIGTLNLPGADGTIFLIMTVKSVDL